VATHSNGAWDGRNLIPDHNALGYDANLVNLFPQLDNYLAALSLKIFGDSPWAARLPFALCGIGSLLVFWRLLLLESRGSHSPGLCAGCRCAVGSDAALFPQLQVLCAPVLLTMGDFVFLPEILQSRRLVHAAIIGILAGLFPLTAF